MVVRRDEKLKGKIWGMKMARTMAATMVVVPGVLANPMIVDRNVGYAVEASLFPESVYVGQRIDLGAQGLNYSDYIETSSNYAYFDSLNFELMFQYTGTYTIYINDDQYNIKVKNYDYNEDGLIDIADIVKLIATEYEIIGTDVRFGNALIENMLHDVEYALVEPYENQMPVVRDVNFSNVLPSSENSIELGCNQYFTDPDNDYLTYTIQSVSNQSALEAKVINDELMIKAGSTPGLSTVTVRAHDGQGGFADADFTFQPNQAPTQEVTSISLPTLGATYISLESLFTDPDGDDEYMTYELSSQYIGGLQFTLSSETNFRELTILASSPFSSPVTLGITATDELGLSTPATFTVTLGGGI